MTRKEFEQVRESIEGEKLQATSSDALAFGIQRSAFECQKLKRLIAAAKSVSSVTVKNKRAGWERQLKKTIAAGERFEKLRDELKAARPELLFVLPCTGA